MTVSFTAGGCHEGTKCAPVGAGNQLLVAAQPPGLAHRRSIDFSVDFQKISACT
jgi:hypothetical protein